MTSFTVNVCVITTKPRMKPRKLCKLEFVRENCDCNCVTVCCTSEDSDSDKIFLMSNKISLLYFSLTGNTKHVCEELCRCLKKKEKLVEVVDLILNLRDGLLRFFNNNYSFLPGLFCCFSGDNIIFNFFTLF